MPLEGQNFKHNNKLVYKILKAACLDTNAWPWIQKDDGDGRAAGLKLFGHYDGYGELNKRVERRDGKNHFPFPSGLWFLIKPPKNHSKTTKNHRKTTAC